MISDETWEISDRWELGRQLREGPNAKRRFPKEGPDPKVRFLPIF